MTERTPYDGHPCPMEVTFDIAQEQLVQRGLLKEAVLALRMPRACLAAARERYVCDGAVEVRGHAVCPLEEMSMHAQSIARQVLTILGDDEDEPSLPISDGTLPGESRRGAGPYL